jgi:hypothetical protein
MSHTKAPMSNHTPGPWINDGAEISARPDPENSQSYIAPICVMDSEWHPDIAAANARLISAAPDLLDALMTMPGLGATDVELWAWNDKARAAIDKATNQGESK